MSQLAARLAKLEQKVADLSRRIDQPAGQTGRWWRDGAGRFANDPIFDEMIRLGKAYRRSLRQRKKPKGK
jgi:hypothetical protein